MTFSSATRAGREPSLRGHEVNFNKTAPKRWHRPTDRCRSMIRGETEEFSSVSARLERDYNNKGLNMKGEGGRKGKGEY